MGRPSDKRRSAMRLGRAERIRVKRIAKPSRVCGSWQYVPGVGYAWFRSRRKKAQKVWRAQMYLRASHRLAKGEGDSCDERMLKTGAGLSNGQVSAWLRGFVVEK